LIPGLGGGRDSFNWNEAPQELVDKMQIPRNVGIAPVLNRIGDVIDFDPPGIGNAEAVPATLDEYCAWIHAKCKTTPYIVAHSIGCVVANRYCQLYGAAGLILLDPTPDWLIEQMRDPEYYTKHGGKHDIVRKYIDILTNTIVTPTCKNTLVVYNTQTGDKNAEKQREYINCAFSVVDAEVINVHDKTHFMHLTVPDTVNSLVTNFIASP